jgi:hypothetical protein
VAYPILDDWSVTFWRTKRYLVWTCDLELDLGTKMGPGRPKNKSPRNGFKMDVCIGLIDMIPTQLKRAQTDIIFSRYHDLFISSNRQEKDVDCTIS